MKPGFLAHSPPAAHPGQPGWLSTHCSSPARVVAEALAAAAQGRMADTILAILVWRRDAILTFCFQKENYLRTAEQYWYY
jgi:hypothetical protein